MKILSDWLDANEETAAGLARRLKASRSAVHRIVAGSRKPSATMAQNIARVTGIPASKLRPDLAKVFHGGA
jgi:transcriptional regulator with XRE-family HTH domain